ncbi:MAG: carboxypeptidase-like regulatory domain-containing protein, partial [Lentimicrobium sp.]|nr:carboxypeptidase-like regulatory domain-containing protein [Lentimicrobium sp.]
MKKRISDITGILRKILFPALAAIMLLGPCVSVDAQITKVRGKVTDASTGEAMPFVNIYFKGTSIGATSDLEGFYSIETKIGSDTLVASSVGYGVARKHIIKGRYQEINFLLIPNRIDLAEVVIRPGENP